MTALPSGPEYIEPFIEHQGERRAFWLRKPRPVGKTLLIARRGTSVPGALAGRTLIVLDVRGAAFGTGGHGTTEGCLAALESGIVGGESVLDAGTGSGILAIAAHKLGAGRVAAVDIDGAACLEARRNLALNGIVSGVEVIEGGIASAAGPFDVVVANIRAPILVDLMDELAGAARGARLLILSGLLERELHPFLSLLEDRSFSPAAIRVIAGWVTLTLKSTSPAPGPARP